MPGIRFRFETRVERSDSKTHLRVNMRTGNQRRSSPLQTFLSTGDQKHPGNDEPTVLMRPLCE